MNHVHKKCPLAMWVLVVITGFFLIGCATAGGISPEEATPELKGASTSPQSQEEAASSIRDF